MRLPAWYAAHDEVLGHMAVVRGEGAAAASIQFAAAAARFRDARHPLDAACCDRLAALVGHDVGGDLVGRAGLEPATKGL